MATITLDQVTLAYKNFAPIEGLSACIPHGQFTALIGPSGCGKSTLLAGIAGQLKPNRGVIKLNGDDVYALPKGELDRRLALLPQKPNALHELTVRELVERGREPYRKWYQAWSSEDEQIVNAAMREAGVGDLGGRTLQELSGGQHQRAWIARTLAQQTDVILVDEPTTFLSVASQEEVLGLLSRLRHEQGRTIVAVLHDLAHAQRFADFVIAMRDGRIAAMGETREMMRPEILSEVFEVDCNPPQPTHPVLRARRARRA
ncbi:MAG: ABC transporter ATP-binding protein [Anaerolineae bacterium]|nr:ABC transporter ATP-binding protein [Anaerolineae bacterium]